MVTINLVSLILNFNTSDRVFLVIFDIFIHFSFMQQISWYVPHNGEDCPNIVIFFRNSIFITTLILIETIILRKLSGFKQEIPAWIDTINHHVIKSIVGGFFAIETSKSNDTESGDNDVVKLVESNDESNKNIKWMQLAKIIDRLLLIIFVVVYFFMILLLVPETYESSAGLPKIDVENKNSTD